MMSLTTKWVPGFLLPDGQAIFVGATGNSTIYTPSGTTSMGTWTAGPVLPNSLVTADAPGAMMVNGKILYTMSPGVFNSPTYFYEYDSTLNSFTLVNGLERAVPRIQHHVTFGIANA